MDRVTAVAISIAIALACVAGAMVFSGDQSIAPEPIKEYKITYELDDGTLSDNAPTTFVPGEELTIPYPTKPEVIFQGWYLDENLEHFFKGDTSDLTGDIVLYAKWGEDLAGHSVTFIKSGYLDKSMDSYDVSGSLTCTYLYYNSDKESYFIRNDDTTTYDYKYIQQKYTKEESTTYWSKNVGREAVEEWTETIETINGPVLCNAVKFVYDTGMTETLWMDANGWITYKIEDYYYTEGFFYDTEYSVVYTMVSESVEEIKADCNINVFEGRGISVKGNDGPYKLGSSVTLTASTESGIKFSGWYDENFNLLSSKTSYNMIVGGDITIYALNDDATDATITSDIELDLNNQLDLSDATFTISNIESDKILTSDDGKFTFEDGGIYEIWSTESDGRNGYFVVMVKGDVYREFKWTFDNYTYMLSLEIDYEDYLYAKDLYSVKERRTNSSNNYAHDKTFVTYSYTDDVMAPYMEELVNKMIDALKSRYSNISEKTLLNYVLKFSQSFEYQSDEEYMGYEEYWKFPLETLYDQGGDCEDTSILLCAIAHQCREKLNMSYNTAMLLLPEHMAGAIKLSGSTKWSYAETTSDTYDLGSIPSKVKKYVNDSRYYTVVEVA